MAWPKNIIANMSRLCSPPADLRRVENGKLRCRDDRHAVGRHVRAFEHEHRYRTIATNQPLTSGDDIGRHRLAVEYGGDVPDLARKDTKSGDALDSPQASRKSIARFR